MIEPGTKVRIKESELDMFTKAFKKRVMGRIGVVRGNTVPSGTPIVWLLADGRKKEFRVGAIHERYLEIVDESKDQP